MRLAHARRPAGELADDDTRLVAHGRRVDVLEGLRRLLDGGHVQPALVRERERPRRARALQTGALTDSATKCDASVSALELLVADHVDAHLEHERRDDADEVGVAARSP